MTRPLAALVLAALALPALAERGPSTKAERQRAVEVTRRLEQDPLGKRGDEDRVWLFQWIVDIPDINVRTCESPLDQLKDDEGDRHGRELFLQHVFGVTTFLIENPAKKDDWVAQQVAGLESVLRAYRSLRKAAPAVRWRSLDRYDELRRDGKLADAVKKTMPGCDPATADERARRPRTRSSARPRLPHPAQHEALQVAPLAELERHRVVRRLARLADELRGPRSP